MFTVIITFTNESKTEIPFKIYSEALDFVRNKISYCQRVKRVEIYSHDADSYRAVWDSAWDDVSKYAGLWGKS